MSAPRSRGVRAPISNAAPPVFLPRPSPLSHQQTNPYPNMTATSSVQSFGGASDTGRLLVPSSRVSNTSHKEKQASSLHFELSPDPSTWGPAVITGKPEPDDYLHNPTSKDESRFSSIFSLRGIFNISVLLTVALGLVVLFAGYPIVSYFKRTTLATSGSLNLGGTNDTGQIPSLTGNWGLIDKDTPQDAYTITSYQDGSPLQLVFSDEFSVDGRTFYPGDDPYWEAVDLHYWQTGNLEWYDPVAITTANGHLQITLSAMQTHDLNYQGGMMSTWNKFCFSGGLLQASVVLPGSSSVTGLWPAIWTVGNLGRAGYGASLEGLWPYTYNSCDVGTLPNQTINGQPEAAVTTGDADDNYALSYLSGQRLSACTCPSWEDHPGPKNTDGSYVGRSAPEIDVFEAQVDHSIQVGKVSQSAQFAPFDPYWTPINTSDAMVVHDTVNTVINSWKGNNLQEAASAKSVTDQNCYDQGGTKCFSTYGFEYRAGADGYITWVSNGRASWTIYPAAVAPNAQTQVGQRLIPVEPMYIIMNLGLSESFGTLSPDLAFPTTMYVDWVRVYQAPDKVNIGCDPEDYPTMDYINRHPEAYTNANLTTWAQYGGAPVPNRLVDTC